LRNIEAHPLLNYLHGSAAWDADISVVKKSAQIIINSNLQGISSSLPQPFSKRADEVMTLHVEKKPVLSPSTSLRTGLPKRPVPGKACPDKTTSHSTRLPKDGSQVAGYEPCPKVEGSVAEGQDVITAQLGNLLSARLARRNENGAMVIKRGTVNFGAQDKSLESKRVQELPRGKDGVWLVGSLPALSVQGWEGLAGGTGKAGPALPIAGVNLRIEKLTGYGQSISALHIDAAKRGDGLAAQLTSSALNGEVVWEPHGYATGSMFRAHLSNLQWLSDEQPEQPLPSAEPVKPALPDNTEHAVIVSQLHPGNLPALDISIENLQLKGKQIGRFELVGHRDGKDWRLRRLNITNPDGSLAGDGVWSDKAGQMQTQLNLVLDISDAGKILGRSGYPNTVKGGSGRLVANLSWVGTPDEFSYATLNGTLKLDTNKGRFLKMDSGAGKLLSVLSLQDLPKHIALGFTDVFSEGFQFDNINGNATIKDGVIETQDFHLNGSSAKVTMKGNVDLNNETQNLRVRILPNLGGTISLVGLIVISPAVGIGSLIVDTLFGNPFDKMVSFEYNVSGTWSDFTVVKVGEGQAKEINPIE
jgi:uncharacterized protein YhdP